MYYAVKKYNCFGVILLGLALLVLQACEKFEYSPYEIRLREDEKHINNHNIAKINALQLLP